NYILLFNQRLTFKFWGTASQLELWRRARSRSTKGLDVSGLSTSMVDVDRSAQGAARQSYATILRSSAIMGASFAIVMVFSFARMKVMALLVGPSGVGLLGVLST